MDKLSIVLTISREASRVINLTKASRLPGIAFVGLAIIVSVTSKPSSRAAAVHTASHAHGIGMRRARSEPDHRPHHRNGLCAHYVARPPAIYLSSNRMFTSQLFSPVPFGEKASYGDSAQKLDEEITMSYGRDDDDYLKVINRARRDDTRAREIVVTDPEIKKICGGICKNKTYRGRDKEFDDILQTARLKILEQIGTAKEFKDVKGFYSWVYAITKNECLRPYRKDKYLADDDIKDVIEAKDVKNSDKYFAQVAYPRMLTAEIRQKVQTLDSLDQRIFSLWFEEGFSITEIATMLERPRKTIYRRLERMAKILVPFNPRKA